ncbi:MAG: hypothetical protein ABL881_07965 [Novosphingobium sp.]
MSANDLVVPLLATAALLGFWFVANRRTTTNNVTSILDRRESPSQEEFLRMMESDVSRETAESLWDLFGSCLPPQVKPHPSDNVIEDLFADKIFKSQWLYDFAQRNGFDHSDLPTWPSEWSVTVRNFGLWLDMGKAASRQS